MRFACLAALLALLTPLAGCGESGGGAATTSTTGGDSEALTLAVIPKGTTHLFWQSVEAGAEQAAQELNVNIHWKGPLKESDRAGQIDVMQQFISQGVDGIALAPLDSKALRGPVDQANRSDIPVVIFDSSLDGSAGEDYVSFVATDNREGGRLAGEKLAELIGGEGDVVLLRYMVGSASTVDREAGFMEVMEQHEGITVISDNQYAGATAGTAQQKALNMLDRLREADAIFTPNESSTYGMLQALRQEGIAKETVFVGFDASPPLIEALKEGEIDALVAQNPTRMGYTAVKTLVEHLRGETVPATIDTGAAVITRENMDDPDIAPLLP
ncbi:MAG: substrate-binding domain-containing protein [Phycisphaeraceae bacterium]